MPSEKAIIVDIDGTLANIEHRVHHIKGQQPDWKSFFTEMAKDKIQEWCKLITNYLPVKVILVTGRPEEYRLETETWLKQHEIQYTELYMRPKGDNRKDTMVKKEIYEKNIRGFYEIVCVIEDRSQVVEMWRSLGLVCLQCDIGDF